MKLHLSAQVWVIQHSTVGLFFFTFLASPTFTTLLLTDFQSQF